MASVVERYRKDLISVENTAYCMADRSFTEHGSKDWHEARRCTLCASEMGAILGLDPNKSRKKTLQEKATPFDQRPPMAPVAQHMCDVGRIFEPVALQKVQEISCYPLMDMGSLVSELYLLEGRPDAVTLDPVYQCGSKWLPIEVKTRVYPNPIDSVPYTTKWDVPEKHWVQLQCYMTLLDADRGLLVSFSPRGGIRVYEAKHDVDLGALICWRTREFENGTLKPRVSKNEKEKIVTVMRNFVLKGVREYAFCPYEGQWEFY